MDETFHCAFCFEANSIFVDPSGGEQQSYVEDCQVCCQPNVLYITWDEYQHVFCIDSQPEG
jgi:hypothetical protein